MHRWPLCLTFVVVALVGETTAQSSMRGGGGAMPDRVFGIVLRQPLNPRAVADQRCFTARQFALERGHFSVVADDVLFSVPDEHEDTAAVLAALDSFTVCRATTHEFRASAIITLSDGVVEHVLISWPDGNAPTLASIRAQLTRAFGEPLQSAWGVPYWSSDSMAVHLTDRGPYGDGTTLTVSDARICERFERMVHSKSSRDQRREPCWKEPKPLAPEDIFTDPAVSLADSDLVAAGVAYDADSGQVRRTLGAPASTDSSSWTYPGLRISFNKGRVSQMALTTSARATARGLRVGDRVGRAKLLYGTPCIREIWTYCRTVTLEPDLRAMMLEVKDHVITKITVGAVFAPE